MTLVWRPGYGGAAVSDPDAMAYLQAVEVADNQALEQGVQQAVNQFVIGCKADGIWTAIKASCILAGARTLTGALIPLVGTAPTNVNFVSGDYNRKTGLVGDGSTKYLNSNRNNNADPQNSQHICFYATALESGPIIGVNEPSLSGTSTLAATASRSRSSNFDTYSAVAGFSAINRSSDATYSRRTGGISTIVSRASELPSSDALWAFRSTTVYSSSRLAFYSIGESLNLALLDARVTTLINAFAAAIP